MHARASQSSPRSHNFYKMTLDQGMQCPDQEARIWNSAYEAADDQLPGPEEAAIRWQGSTGLNTTLIQEECARLCSLWRLPARARPKQKPGETILTLECSIKYTQASRIHPFTACGLGMPCDGRTWRQCAAYEENGPCLRTCLCHRASPHQTQALGQSVHLEYFSGVTATGVQCSVARGDHSLCELCRQW